MARSTRKSNSTTKIFADRLSDLVEEKKKSGLTQKEIAAGIGCASGALSEWCSDNKTAAIDALPKIADYFNVSASWLIGCSDVREQGTEVQTIHHETGLSAAAICRLKVDKLVEDNSYIQILNKIVESESFSDMAKLAEAYCKLQDDGSIHIDLSPFVPNLDDISINKVAFLKTLLTEYFFRALDGK